MRWSTIIFFTLLITTSSITSLHSQENQSLQPVNNITSSLDTYFSALANLQKFNGAVLIQKDGEVIFHNAYNMKENVESSLYVNRNDQFDIHSVSKLMAKACIVKLEGENLISREDYLNDYITDFPNGELISIEHLLDNQSGLPRELSVSEENLIEKSPEEFVSLIKKEALIYTPGSETLYSNLGYELVYYIISKITGKPFVQYVNETFFIPLEMNASGAHFYLNNDNLINPVKNHIEDDGEIIVVPNYTKTGKNQSKIYTTLSDLLKFINAMKIEPYRSSLINKGGNIGWSGGGEGILCHAESKIASGYELVFFSNYDEISFGGILEDVEKIMTNKPFIIPKEINRKAINLKRDIIEKYVGKYDMAEFNHDEFEIRIENDSVVFYQNGEKGAILLAENDSTFFENPTDENYCIFQQGKDGNYEMIFKYKGMDIIGVKKPDIATEDLLNKEKQKHNKK